MQSELPIQQTRYHLAILSKKYLDLILCSYKFIESRLTVNPILPYQRVFSNDIIFLKESGGMIKAKVKVVKAMFVMGKHHILEKVDEFQNEKGLGFDRHSDFIKEKLITPVLSEAKYLSLIWLSDLELCCPFSLPYEKKGQLAWMLLKKEESHLLSNKFKEKKS